MISVIVPVYNEEEVIETTSKELFYILESMGDKNFEVIFVDDGSDDDTSKILREVIKRTQIQSKIVILARNYGKSKALNVGFKEAKGDIIITMDADGQDDPGEIEKLLNVESKTKAGVVCGYRKNRKDRFTKILVSKVYNNLIRIFFGLSTHDNGCGMKLIRGDLAKTLKLRKGEHRYITVMAKRNGEKVEEVEVHHRERMGGRSKYKTKRIIEGLLDLIYLKIEPELNKEKLAKIKERVKKACIIGGVALITTITVIAVMKAIIIWSDTIMYTLIAIGMLSILITTVMASIYGVIIGIEAINTKKEKEEEPNIKEIITNKEKT